MTRRLKIILWLWLWTWTRSVCAGEPAVGSSQIGIQTEIGKVNAALRQRLLVLPSRDLGLAVTHTDAPSVLAELHEQFVKALTSHANVDVLTTLERQARAHYGASMSVNRWRLVGRRLEPDNLSFQLVDAASRQTISALNLASHPRGGYTSIGLRRAVCRSASHCVAFGAERLAAGLAELPWAGSVLSVEGGRVWVDAGLRHGLVVGMTLKALTAGEPLLDPETGFYLGLAYRDAGRLRVTETGDLQSVATIVDGCEDLARGDRLQLLLRSTPP